MSLVQRLLNEAVRGVSSPKIGSHWYCCAGDGYRGDYTRHPQFLDGHIYAILDRGLTRRGKNIEHRFQLQRHRLTGNLDQISVSDGSVPFAMSFSEKDLLNYFAYGKEPNTTAKLGSWAWIGQAIQSIFDDLGFEEEVDPNINWVRLVEGITNKVLVGSTLRAQPHEKEELIAAALEKTLNTRAWKRYRLGTNPVGYFTSIFKGDILDEYRAWLNRLQKEKPLVDMGRDREPSQNPFYHVQAPPSWDPAKKVEIKNLVDGMSQYLRSQKNGDRLVEVFLRTVGDHKGRDIARALNITPAAVSQFQKRIRDLLWQYARKSGNEALLKTIKDRLKVASAEDYGDQIRAALREAGYDLSSLGHVPVGACKKVKKKTFSNPSDKKQIAQMILDPNRSSEDVQEAISTQAAELMTMDDLIEEDDSIIGLYLSQ